LIATLLLKWYLDHGLVVTKVHEVIEYVARACFKEFVSGIVQSRREGDKDFDKSILSELCKLLGNSSYGSTLINKENYTNITYCGNETDGQKLVNSNLFKKMNEISDDFYEFELHHKTVKLDTPCHVGYFILQIAKLRMLEFYYDCLLKYIPRNNFALTEIDTDSMYFGLSKASLIDCVKPELKQEFLNKLHSCHSTDFFADNNTYFPRICCKQHIDFDKRTPGLFKLEAEGKSMVCLCSKTYALLKDNDECKVSCKGITKSKFTDPYTKMTEALFNPSNKKLNEVVGFRVCNNTIKTYEQTKKGLSFFYVKRKVQNDLISTEPLTFELNPWVDCNNVVINEKNNNILALSYPFEFSYGGKDYDNI
jgi:hypothetical protein